MKMFIECAQCDFNSREELEKYLLQNLSYLQYQEFLDIVNNDFEMEEAFKKGYRQAETEYQISNEHYNAICWDLIECLEDVLKGLSVERLNKQEREEIVKNIKYQIQDAKMNL